MGALTRLESGTLIRDTRRRMGLSQIEVASLADVSRRTIQNLESGNSSVKASSLQAVGEVLDLEFNESDSLSATEVISNVSSFGYWPFRMFKFVSAKISTSDQAFCYCEHEFRDILNELWENFQHGLENFCPNKARSIIEAYPTFCCRDGYITRYFNIWRSNPKTFSFSAVNGRRTGVSIVLPVAAATFDDFLSGRRGNFGIQGDEILPTSPTVIYESIAPFFNARDTPHSVGGSLAFVSMNHLSQVLPYVRTHRCDVGSFAAHRENIDKIRSVGMKPVGTQLPKLKFPIWQASNRIDFESDEEEETRSSTLLHYLSLKQKRDQFKQKRDSFKAKLSFSVIGAMQANHLVETQHREVKDVA